MKQRERERERDTCKKYICTKQTIQTMASLLIDNNNNTTTTTTTTTNTNQNNNNVNTINNLIDNSNDHLSITSTIE